MKWKTAWSYLPIDYGIKVGTLKNITQVTTMQNNINGNRVRVRFSNQYASSPLVLDRVLIGRRKPGSKHIETMGLVKYKGMEQISIPAGHSFYSDSLDCEIRCCEDIVLSIYFKERTDIRTICVTWAAQSWQTAYYPDEHPSIPDTAGGMESVDVYPVLKQDIHRPTAAAGFCGIQVYTNASMKTVSLFGDSITHMSYYSDALTNKLYTKYPGQITVLNRGIGGNRLLFNASYAPEAPGKGHLFGRAGIKRFRKDVFGSVHPDVVLVLIGINDLMHPYFLNHLNEIVTSEELVHGLEQLIEMAHANKAKILLGTIMPFRYESATWDTGEAERVRNECNTWIREQNISDGVMDFDACVRDPGKSGFMIEDYHLGDGLHPNLSGGEAMIDAVPYESFFD